MQAGLLPAVCRIALPLLFLPLAVFSQALPDTSAINSFAVALPLSQIRVTSGFGWRVHPVTKKADFHRGVDLAAHNDPIYSIMDGTVCQTGSNPILGNYIRIDHGAVQSIYGHLSFILVRPGQAVCAGQLLGVTGSTGRTTGEHLHFSIRSARGYIHPLQFLKAAMQPQ